MFVAIAIAILPAESCAEESSLRRTPVVIAVEKASPAVVNISTERVVQVNRPFINPRFDLWSGTPIENRRTAMRTTSLGSGLIIDPDGFILTNDHVVRTADKILVQIGGEKDPVEAYLLSSDPESDLALLRVRVDHDLPWLPLGTSSDLMIGETVIAIGNPFGLASTVSVGVLSATERAVSAGGNSEFHDFLQTDTSINPGNSGGPLLNIKGEVIGINIAIRADAQGIGFAIPIDRARRVVGALSDPARVASVYFGLVAGESESGAATRILVASVTPAGPAEQAQVMPGEMIIKVANHPVQNFIQLNKRLLAYRPGDKISLTLRSARGEERVVEIQAATPPLSKNQSTILARLGFLGRDVSADELAGGLPRGYLITEVRPDSNASAVGLRAGDVFVGIIDGRYRITVQDEAQVIELLSRIKPGATVNITIRRKGEEFLGPLAVE